MGGHHQHEARGSSTRSGSWEGYEALRKALEGLATAKGVSQSRIGAVAKLAAQNAKPRVRHVIEEWQKRGIYTAAQLEAAGGRAYIWSEADSAEAQTPDRQTGNVTPRTSPGKLASLLSILKKKKEEHEYAPQPSEQRQQPPYEATYDNKQGRQGDDAYTHERRSYEERPTDEQQYGRREVGGIMGDAPGVPVGSGRIRRAPEEAENSRGTKKPRGSRWGPPKMANAPQSERPAPIITFAHGYEDLDNAASRAPMHGDRDGIDDSTGRRWRASPNAQPGGREPSQLAPSVHNATAAVPPQQARPYGAAQAVYNEPQGDRGSSGGGASSMFYANGAAPSPGGRRLPPGQLPTSTTGQQGSQPMYTSAPSGYATQGLSYSSGIDQGPASVKPSPSSQTYPTPPIGGHAAVATGSKVLADDDDGDTAEPEFTLQYDDDD
ncbi:hypothetical protein BBJ28_00005481 [Nothophytophthora sp. Chile5]|nr:hypothetical protein BBJ28_00005481 [Nothophytophthora sp. Chile5]